MSRGERRREGREKGGEGGVGWVGVPPPLREILNTPLDPLQRFKPARVKPNAYANVSRK